MTASGCGSPGSGPSSGSGGSRGGEVVTASGGGNTDSPACSGGGVRACGIGKFTQIVTLGQLAPVQQPLQGSFRRDWNAVMYLSCGKAGHSATRCPTLDETFPFMLPGWKAEKTPDGYIMISPQENGD